MGGTDAERAAGGAFVPRVRGEGALSAAPPDQLTLPSGRLHLAIERERPVLVRSGAGAGTRLEGLSVVVDGVSPPLEGPAGARGQLLLGVAHDELEAHLGESSGFSGHLRSVRSRPFAGALVELPGWGGAWGTAEDGRNHRLGVELRPPGPARGFLRHESRPLTLDASSAIVLPTPLPARRAAGRLEGREERLEAGLAVESVEHGRLAAFVEMLDGESFGAEARLQLGESLALDAGGRQQVRRVDGSLGERALGPIAGLAAGGLSREIGAELHGPLPGGGDARVGLAWQQLSGALRALEIGEALGRSLVGAELGLGLGALATQEAELARVGVGVGTPLVGPLSLRTGLTFLHVSTSGGQRTLEALRIGRTLLQDEGGPLQVDLLVPTLGLSAEVDGARLELVATQLLPIRVELPPTPARPATPGGTPAPGPARPSPRANPAGPFDPFVTLLSQLHDASERFEGGESVALRLVVPL